MGQRYDTVLELHVRVRRELERISNDPTCAGPAELTSQVEALMDEEFGALQVHAPKMNTPDLANLLGSSDRVLVYARLLQMRAVSTAATGQGDAASHLAKQALELYVHDAVAQGDLALEHNAVEHLRRLMLSLSLSSRYDAALRTLVPQRYG
ncbi:MAG: hypothetical protein KUG77_24130 [Nannocystaceae bacterium]|nr:hypothetical protein [Nannocystaceae bacterium]